MWEYRMECLAAHGHDRLAEGTFKYIFEVDIERQLNKLGEDGWEVVSISDGLIQGLEATGYTLLKRRRMARAEIDAMRNATLWERIRGWKKKG